MRFSTKDIVGLLDSNHAEQSDVIQVGHYIIVEHDEAFTGGYVRHLDYHSLVLSMSPHIDLNPILIEAPYDKEWYLVTSTDVIKDGVSIDAPHV